MTYEEVVKVAHRMGWKTEFIEELLDAIGYRQMQERIEKQERSLDGATQFLAERTTQRDAAREVADQLAKSCNERLRDIPLDSHIPDALAAWEAARKEWS